MTRSGFVAWDDDPKRLMAGCAVMGVLAAAFSLATPLDHRGFPAAGALSAIASVLMGYRAWRIERARRLSPAQRTILVERLRRVLMTFGPRSGGGRLTIRLAAVGDPEAVAYARLLLRAVQKAGWHADGIAKAPITTNAGVSLAIRDARRPPDEARDLVLAFAGAGILVAETEKASLEERVIELQVGAKP
jgi:hypothetical protein